MTTKSVAAIQTRQLAHGLCDLFEARIYDRKERRFRREMDGTPKLAAERLASKLSIVRFRIEEI